MSIELRPKVLWGEDLSHCELQGNKITKIFIFNICFKLDFNYEIDKILIAIRC